MSDELAQQILMLLMAPENILPEDVAAISPVIAAALNAAEQRGAARAMQVNRAAARKVFATFGYAGTGLESAVLKALDNR